MSHFTRLRTQIVKKNYLLQALKDLGYTAEEGELTVHAVGGGRQAAEVKVRLGMFGREVGFRKMDEQYEIVADWWGLPAKVREEFQYNLMQRYAYRAALGMLTEQGFSLVADETQKDGQIHLTMRRMA